jgi:hypothetical protein
MDRQARTGDTVLVKSREMTDRSQTLPWCMARGRRGKDDRKQNTLALLVYIIQQTPEIGSSKKTYTVVFFHSLWQKTICPLY